MSISFSPDDTRRPGPPRKYVLQEEPAPLPTAKGSGVLIAARLQTAATLQKYGLSSAREMAQSAEHLKDMSSRVGNNARR